MKRIFLIVLCYLLWANANAQLEDAWVYFKDKPSEASFLASPLTMLAQRSLDRRTSYGIALDSKDVPLEATYVSQVNNSTGITVLARSKWLNSLHIQGTEVNIVNLLNLNFVERIDFADKSLNAMNKMPIEKIDSFKGDKLKFTTNFDYGNGTNQIEQLNGHILHENNFTGSGMWIAILDAGFPNVDNFAAFKRIRDNSQILGGYDFVNRDTNFYTGSSHGMSVLSTIAAYIDNQFIGTAPDANFYLFITEDDSQETPLEESLWVEAAERADSLGVDVMNTSLGYYTFDNPDHNYSYNDMDGQTTFITQGAEIAFSRGMILLNSAGNEGDDPWHYIIAPADANSVLSIGAVNSAGTIAGFSSYGPTSDTRIKPDVLAQGSDVYVINSSGNIATSAGTSFSTPVMTGVVACLWQAFPDKTNTEIIQLVKESAHLFLEPTDQEGYGIPNFQSIYNLLAVDDQDNIVDFIVYPNPTSEAINFNIPAEIDEIGIEIFDLSGKKVLEAVIDKTEPTADISHMSQGMYIIRVNYKDNIDSVKIIKIE